ncbi:MAG: LytTR family DNA-binding domain-containing protein [Bacteroidota bacterium]
MTTKYIIVDDESIAHDIIKNYCDMMPSMQLMQNCYDAIEAIEYLNLQSVDLIFLDLNMPKLKGFDFLKTLSHPPKVIVTTAYREYALEGYELDIVDYLLKPFSFERFLKAVNKAIGKPTPQQTTPVEKDQRIRRIFLSANKKHYQIELDDLIYIEASGNYIKLILKKETINIREKLSAITERLPNKEFIQVHRSFVVAIPHIKRIEGNQIFLEEASIPIGKSYRTEVGKIFG